MVTVIKTKLALNKDGKPFIALKLQGDPEFIQSSETGKFYLTAKTCYITSTFDEATAKALINKQLPGSIERVACQPYQYTLESTGEVISLSHRYEYRPDPVPGKSSAQHTPSNDLEVFEELEM